MDFTKSRIKWTRRKEVIPAAGDPTTWYLQGRAPDCDFYIHIYGKPKEWYWSIRSWNRRTNLIVGHHTHDRLRDALSVASKWAIVQFIRQIDANLFRRIHDDDTIRWEQSLTEERLQRGVPWINTK
jgi:hypothetical protein